MKVNCLIKDKAGSLIILGLYLVFNWILLMRHEMWRDEINVWLMGRELSVVELFQEIKYQGHPCLWYLIVMPFAKLGFSCRIMGVISLLVMTITAAIYLYLAPINFWIKALSLFGPMFTYHYSINARGYCLVALLVIILAWQYKKRNENPVLYGVWLGLLVQADTIALPIAGMISVMWLGENLWKGIRTGSRSLVLTALRGLWIPLLSLFLWIAQFYRVSDSPVFSVQIMDFGELIKRSLDFASWIGERLTGIERSVVAGFYLVILVNTIVLSIWRKKLWPVLVMLASFLFQCIFSLLIYELYITHFISLCFVFIWMIWVLCEKEEKEEGKLPGFWSRIAEVFLQGSFLILAGLMLLKWNSPDENVGLSNALKGVISDGEHAASYLRENLSSQELIITVNVPYASTIWAFAEGYPIYFAGNRKIVSYADWSEEQTREISFEELLKWVRAEFPEKDSFVLIDTFGSFLTEGKERLKEAVVLYETAQPTIKNEDYTIYRIESKSFWQQGSGTDH